MSTALSDEIMKDIMNHIHRSSDSEFRFITKAQIHKIWTLECETGTGKQTRLKQFLRNLGWTDEPFLTHVKENLLKILSILVRIKWTEWPKFREVFGDHVDDSGEYDRLDVKLPFKDLEQFENKSFSTDSADDFRTHQYTFIPVEIFVGKDRIFPDEKLRMPFVGEPIYLGEGSYSMVSKESVAIGQYFDLDEKPNESVQVIVRKSFGVKTTQYQKELEDERRILAKLRSSLFDNSRIMQSLGSVTRGLHMDIFFPFAQLDLDEFLFDKKDADFIAKPVAPVHLINEMGGLADALDFLHTGEKLRFNEGGSWICAHMDLKPANIVIVKHPGQPVGRWKITDFGLSRLKISKDSEANDTYTFVREASLRYSLTTPKRGEGTFMAPEVEKENTKGVGPKGDIWSLGCILSLVLGYAIGGDEKVKAFETQRRTEIKNGRSVRKYGGDHFYCDEGREVKCEVITWLDGLIEHNNVLWIRYSVSLIKEMLKVAPENRPKAKHVREYLFREVVPSIMKGEAMEHEDSTCVERQGPSRHAPANEEAAQPRVVMDAYTDSVGAPEAGTPIPPVVAYPDRAIVKANSTFVEIIHEEHIIQTALSTSGLVAYLSKKKVYLLSMSLLDQRKLWRTKLSSGKIPFDNGHFVCRSASTGYTWKSMALAGHNLLLQGRNSQLQKTEISLYDTSSTDCIKEIKTLVCPCDLLGAIVSMEGDIALRFSNYIELYVARNNWSTKRWTTRYCTQWILFSADGEWLYWWSKDKGSATLFFWGMRHLTSHPELQSSLSSPNKEFVPFSKLPAFATWDSNPGQVSIFQAPWNRPTETPFEGFLDGIKAGIATPASNAIVFLRNIKGIAHDTGQFCLVPLYQGEDGLLRPTSKNPPRTHKLGYRLCKCESECGRTIYTDDTGLVRRVVLAHGTGVIESIECISE